jgi:hypothetical protein
VGRRVSAWAVSVALLCLAGSATARPPLPGLMTGPAPWPANTRQLGTRLAALGLPALRSEGLRLHTHQHLDVVVEGRLVPVPAGIGIDPAGRFIAEVHTHDASGIVHVEAPRRRRFTLGELFDVWGLRFSARCLGAYCAQGKRRVWVFVGGTRAFGDPRRLELGQHQEIVVAYGSYASIPKPIPASYPFPAGL